MTRGGREDEAKECFHIFDKKEKSFVSFHDVALVLREYIRSDLSDDEVREFMKEIDPALISVQRLKQTSFVMAITSFVLSYVVYDRLGSRRVPKVRH